MIVNATASTTPISVATCNIDTVGKITNIIIQNKGSNNVTVTFYDEVIPAPPDIKNPVVDVKLFEINVSEGSSVILDKLDINFFGTLKIGSSVDDTTCVINAIIEFI